MEVKKTIALATYNQVDQCHNSSFSPWQCRPLLCLWAVEAKKKCFYRVCKGDNSELQLQWYWMVVLNSSVLIKALFMFLKLKRLNFINICVLKWNITACRITINLFFTFIFNSLRQNPSFWIGGTTAAMLWGRIYTLGTAEGWDLQSNLYVWGRFIPLWILKGPLWKVRHGEISSVWKESLVFHSLSKKEKKVEISLKLPSVWKLIWPGTFRALKGQERKVFLGKA